MRKQALIFLSLITLTLACVVPALGAQPAATTSPAPADTLTSLPMTETSLPTATPSPTASPSQTSLPPTITLTPTVTQTIGPSATPTFAFPVVTVNKQAHCRYGPHVAYLHAADLYAGDRGTVRYRAQLSKWLFIKFDKLGYYCWVAPSVVDVVGDITTVKVVEFTDSFLPGPSVLYNPPQNVVAVRDGKNVTITWDKLPMTDDDDRGYFLDIFVCQGGGYLWYPVALATRNDTFYTIKDEKGCPAPSGGKLYAVEKHGYTRPVVLNWPQP
jgi:hypothetical protein